LKHQNPLHASRVDRRPRFVFVSRQSTTITTVLQGGGCGIKSAGYREARSLDLARIFFHLFQQAGR
jgi:hypothetical protein